MLEILNKNHEVIGTVTNTSNPEYAANFFSPEPACYFRTDGGDTVPVGLMSDIRNLFYDEDIFLCDHYVHCFLEDDGFPGLIDLSQDNSSVEMEILLRIPNGTLPDEKLCSDVLLDIRKLSEYWRKHGEFPGRERCFTVGDTEEM